MVQAGELSDQAVGQRIDVPIMVDDLKVIDDFRMTRCVYFAAEARDITGDWVVRVRALELPMILVGLSTVICHADPSGGSFESADQIETLFGEIETEGQMIVETADIWLPNLLVERGKDVVRRGDIYRVSVDLFRAALLFRADQVDLATFLKRAADLAGDIEPSPTETEAFRAWSTMQIEASRTNYERLRSEKRVLDWRDESGAVNPG